MNNEQEFSDFARKQYQEAKKLKRTVTVLDQNQVIIFATLLSRNSPLIDYEDKLGLNFSDVERHKELLGLYAPGDAAAFLKAIEEADNTDLLNRKQVEKLKRKDATEREAQLKNDKPKKKRGRPKKKKEYNTKKMQVQLDKQNPVPKSRFRAENDETFKIDARRGINFLVDKYVVARKDVLAELARLKINPDMLPR